MENSLAMNFPIANLLAHTNLLFSSSIFDGIEKVTRRRLNIKKGKTENFLVFFMLPNWESRSTWWNRKLTNTFTTILPSLSFVSSSFFVWLFLLLFFITRAHVIQTRHTTDDDESRGIDKKKKKEKFFLSFYTHF